LILYFIFKEKAYLSVGTEVSAKFKGAFCEAKIKIVHKNVKCKITIKSTNEQIVVSDENIKGVLKVGQIVEARKTDTDEYQIAILMKIQDLSTYTVVFNDGDERTLKRSFLRFKGERHFLECETLNNSPLTHPEHFSNPVKNQLVNTGSSSSSSSSSSPVSINSHNQELKNEHEEIFDQYIDKEENDSSQSDNDCESMSSDEQQSEQKDRFVAQLYKFMDDRDTPMNNSPNIANVDLDLYKLFMIVKKNGGYNKVFHQKRLFRRFFKTL
jgi:hypothetical protein